MVPVDSAWCTLVNCAAAHPACDRVSRVVARPCAEEAVRGHPVTLIAGDTGCGKSTQMPQYLMRAGRAGRHLVCRTHDRHTTVKPAVESSRPMDIYQTCK